MSKELQSMTSIRQAFRDEANDATAEHSQRFFKTGKGEYGEGDKFLGIRVPVVRRYAKQLSKLPRKDVLRFLKSTYHEERLMGAIALCLQFKTADEAEQREIYGAYLAHSDYINNWDIVDSSAHLIVGPYLQNRSHKPLQKLAKSNSLWERRIAMMACYHFIRQQEFDTPFAIATQLLGDDQDLIHKVTGWMLREIGKQDLKAEQVFLDQHYKTMPRTMLRYAIERFPEKLRKAYLDGKR